MGLFVFGLALATQTESPVTEPYRALGSDPAWTLTIADGRMTYETADRAPIVVVTPRQTNDEGIINYDTRALDVSVMPVACTDRSTGKRYAHSVYLTVGREERIGCGGAELEADSLDGTSWHFAEIAGEDTGLTGDILRDDRYAIDFSGDSMVGYSGCNRFSAGYVRSGDMMTTRPPFGSTRGACSESIMSRERHLFQILSKPMRVSFPDPDTMLLTGNDGAIRLTRSHSEP